MVQTTKNYSVLSINNAEVEKACSEYQKKLRLGSNIKIRRIIKKKIRRIKCVSIH